MNPTTISDAEEDTLIASKGKSRAHDATERTPLLNPYDSQSSSYVESTSTPLTFRRSLWSKLISVFLVSLSFCVLIFVLLALLGWSYAAKASKVSPDEILKNALVFRGPDRVDVLNITQNGAIFVNVEARMGFDAGFVVGVNDAPDGDYLFEGIWKSIGRWGVRRLERVSVNLTTIDISPDYDASLILATVKVPPLEVPLTVNPSTDLSWLHKISVPLLIQPTSNTSATIEFLRHSWRQGAVSVRADVRQATVNGGGLDESSWRDIVRKELSNIRAAINFKIPPLPGLPHPGDHLPLPSLTELVTLQSFNVSTESNKLILHARGTLIDPAPPTFNFTSPSMPFTVSLPSNTTFSESSPVPIASVSTAPFTLTHPNITLLISGTVLPLAPKSTSTLSGFMTRYLSGEPNPIQIITPFLPGYFLNTDFPAPHPRPHVLRNVTIRDMKIKPTGPGGTFLASGTVFARVVLPHGIEVGLDVRRVLPDVLIFDGEVPASADFSRSPFLPDPLPERAFGHILPEDWLPSLCVPDKSEGNEGAAYAITAKIIEVPLEVLPGRQKEFSNFVSKVIFGGGAVAGILGSAAVAVEIQGMPFEDPENHNEMELSGLPFQGSVRVGKKTF